MAPRSLALLGSVARITLRLSCTVVLGASVAGCALNSSLSPTGTAGQASAAARGLTPAVAHRAQSSGWIAPDAKRRKPLIYWASYFNSTIDIFSAKGTNPPLKGQITSGLSGPERLFVDKARNLYATNLGNNTVTAYKRGATSPYLTISNGVNSPTGLTVDAAGTVYCANVANNTVTEYPKGQTSPSLTITLGSLQPEFLAIDSADNLYVSYGGGSHGSGVMKFAPGSTKGTDLGLQIGSAYALEVDKAGNIVIIDFAANTIDVFPPGQTQPSKQIAVTTGSAYALTLTKAETRLFVTVEVSGGFNVQQLDYPNGTSLTNKITALDGDWPIAVSPDSVL